MPQSSKTETRFLIVGGVAAVVIAVWLTSKRGQAIIVSNTGSTPNLGKALGDLVYNFGSPLVQVANPSSSGVPLDDISSSLYGRPIGYPNPYSNFDGSNMYPAYAPTSTGGASPAASKSSCSNCCNPCAKNCPPETNGFKAPSSGYIPVEPTINTNAIMRMASVESQLSPNPIWDTFQGATYSQSHVLSDGGSESPASPFLSRW